MYKGDVNILGSFFSFCVREWNMIREKEGVYGCVYVCIDAFRVTVLFT